MNADLFHSNTALRRPAALRNLLLILTFSSATVFALSCLIPISYVTSLSAQGYPRIPEVLVQISAPLSMLYAFTGFNAANLLRLLFEQITPGQGSLVLGVFSLPIAMLGMGAFYSQVRSHHRFIPISAAYTAVAIAAGSYLMGAISAASLSLMAATETTKIAQPRESSGSNACAPRTFNRPTRKRPNHSHDSTVNHKGSSPQAACDDRPKSKGLNSNMQ